MKLKTNENELIQTFTRLIKLPLPELRASLAHKALELEYMFKDDMEDYRELENMVDPGSKQEKPTETEKKSLKRLDFELEKIKGDWKSSPLVHPDVVNHILAHEQVCEPGVIKMKKIKLHGKTIDLSFEMKSPGFIVGSIIKKCSQKKVKQKTTSTPSLSTGKDSEKDKLKTVIAYLLENETFSDWLINEFFSKWKTVIDNGLGFINEINERSHY